MTTRTTGNGARRRRDYDPGPRPAGEPPRGCDWPGCEEPGEYRAPKSRGRLREFHHFCLDHVRDYNRAWNFFEGMSQAEIEAYLRADVTWHRPTWRLGLSGHGPGGDGRHFEDPLDMLGAERDRREEERRRRERARHPGVSARAEEMLLRLDLEPGATLVELKRRYKELVKRHHPDLHDGDRDAEERLKVINEAYTYLRDSGLFT